MSRPATLAFNERSRFVQEAAENHSLREAWSRLQRGGKTAGVDGVTVGAFRRDLDRRLAELGDALMTGRYHPQPVKRVDIPKPAGGWRTLGIPTVADRIAQGAAAGVLHARIAMLFSDRSFAYRPFLGPQRAAAFLRSQLGTESQWVVTADIEKFFDNVEHTILANHLRGVGIDEGGVQLILRWLTVPSHGAMQSYQPIKGLPQGSPIAPILANLYLNGFDTALASEGFRHVRYADDFIVLAPTRLDAERALRFVATYLTSRLRLRLKQVKTQVARIEDGVDFVGYRFGAESWRVPDASLERFRVTIDGLLTANGRRAHEISVEHNAIVRGWRNYFGGQSTEMDLQLAELDQWRRLACREFLTRLGQEPDAADLWFESLVTEQPETTPAGTYDQAVAVIVTTQQDSGDADPWHQHTDTGSSRLPTRQQVHHAAVGETQLPELSGRWLRIPTFGAFVSRSHQIIVIRRKKQIIFEAAFADVSFITLEADGVVLSTTLIDECARRGVPISVCRTSGKVVARVVPARPRLAIEAVRQQWRARAGRSGLTLVKQLVGAKLANQRALLLYHSKYQGRDTRVREDLVRAAGAIRECALLLEQIYGVPMRAMRTQVFAIEARAAAYYWSAFGALVPASFGFTGRLHQDAEDVVNRSLNYGYSVLQNHVWLAVHRSGLEPTLGILHSGRHRSPGLVFDLMEPFRQPVVDRAVIALIGRGALLRVNAKGILTLRTRSLIQRSVDQRLFKIGARAPQLHVHSQVLCFRRALMQGAPYRPFRMTW